MIGTGIAETAVIFSSVPEVRANAAEATSLATAGGKDMRWDCNVRVPKSGEPNPNLQPRSDHGFQITEYAAC